MYILPQTSCGRAVAEAQPLNQTRYPLQAITASYRRSFDVTAQAIRASLLASATTTTFRLVRLAALAANVVFVRWKGRARAINLCSAKPQISDLHPFDRMAPIGDADRQKISATGSR